MEGESYQNPVSYLSEEKIPVNPDPYVIKHLGIYYCYASGRKGVSLSCSKDLVNWEYMGYALSEPECQEYWAPCVIYENGLFYLYVSNTPVNVEDCHQEFLKLYIGDKPEGPFRYEKTFFQKFSIDAHVVKDLDGKVYLFYSVNDYMGTEEQHSGTAILVDRLIDMRELAGEEKPVVLPSLNEEIFEENRFNDGRDWHTIEGAFFWRHHDKAYLMYSANAYVRENYFLGYSVARGNELISEMQWKKYPDNHTFSPLVRRNEKVEGTGHNSVIAAPNLVEDWIVYHGRNQDEPLVENIEQRKMRIDRILYDGGRLCTGAPTYDICEAPAMPLYRTCFEDSQMAGWEIATGRFISGSGVMYTVDEKGCNIIYLTEEVQNYVAEVSIKCDLTHMGGKYGVIACYLDEENYTEVILNSGRRSISVIQYCGNIKVERASRKLAPDFNYEVFHLIKLCRIFGQLEVFLDDCPVFVASIGEEAARVGMVSRYTKAFFAGFAITEHLELFGDKMEYFGRCFVADRMLPLVKGRICEHSGKEVELNGNLTIDGGWEEITFNMLTEDSQIKYCPVYQDKDNYVELRVGAKGFDLIYKAAGSGQIAATGMTANSFTIRARVTNDAIYIGLGERIWRLDIGYTNATRKACVIKRAEIVHYAYTNVKNVE